MLTKTLKRRPIETADDLVDFGDLAREANERLGYSRLADMKSHAAKEQAAFDVLRKADVRPFTEDSVRRYKRRRVLLMNLRWFFVPIVCYVVAAACLLVTFAALIAIVEGSVDKPLIALAVTVPLGIGAFVVALRHGEPQMFSWGIYSMHGASPIPEFALQTAVDVHKLLRDAGVPDTAIGFVTDELHAVKASDPFLVLHLYGKSFYLEVWNEPKFRQERIA